MGKIFLQNISRYSAFLILTLLSASVWSQTLLISDVDDTLKASHVLNKSDALRNTVRIRNHFYGMAELYSAIYGTNPNIDFFYLSAAPEKLMEKLHTAFLKKNGFPTGELILRQRLSDKDFKLNAIRTLIAQHSPQKIILIGDNGERDPYIYERVFSEYPNIQVEIYIHQVYSYRAKNETGASQLSGHTIFVTAIDLARSLVKTGDLPSSELDRLALDTLPDFFKQDPKKEVGPLFIPAWVDCRDFFDLETLTPTSWNLDPQSPTDGPRSPTEWLMAYDRKLAARCQNGPIPKTK